MDIIIKRIIEKRAFSEIALGEAFIYFGTLFIKKLISNEQQKDNALNLQDYVNASFGDTCLVEPVIARIEIERKVGWRWDDPVEEIPKEKVTMTLIHGGHSNGWFLCSGCKQESLYVDKFCTHCGGIVTDSLNKKEVVK